MLKKIDCVMVRVDDLETATAYYVEVFGLRYLWREAAMVGLGFPETDAQMVLHTDPGIPSRVEVHYLVADVLAAVEELATRGCTVVVPPFDIRIGRCAVIRDPFGTTLCILDATGRPEESRTGPLPHTA